MCIPGSSDRDRADEEVRRLQQQVDAMGRVAPPDMTEIITQRVRQHASAPMGRTRQSTFAPPNPPLGFHVMRSLMQGGGRR